MAKMTLSGTKIVKQRKKKTEKEEGYEPLRSDKIAKSLPTEKEHQVVRFYTAIKMMERFRFLPWMTDKNVVSENGERINLHGEVYKPKSRRRR